MSQSPPKDLAGRRILLIGIGFYDYENSIAKRLRQRGAELFVFQDQPPELQSGIRRLFLRDHDTILARHEKRILEAASLPFDQVLVIKAVGLRVPFLNSLRKILPHSEFILYQWDSLTRLAGIEERLSIFNRVLTFDRKDSQMRPEMTFRPLFFRDDPIQRVTVRLDIDVAFVGWLHSDRLELVRRMQAEAKALGLTTFVYMYTGWLTWLKLHLRGQGHDVYPRPLSYLRLQTINRRARCIYDLPHALQTGLTMRTIETLGLNKKLITTAQDIVNYDFCNSDNVRVFSFPDTGLDWGFVKSDPVPIDPTIQRKYSLDAWLDDVLGIPKCDSECPSL